MRSMFAGQGYLISDNRCSGGTLEEADLVGCGHCQRLMRKSDWQANHGAYCIPGDHPLCLPCARRAEKYGCEPFLRGFFARLEDEYRKNQNAKVLGI